MVATPLPKRVDSSAANALDTGNQQKGSSRETRRAAHQDLRRTRVGVYPKSSRTSRIEPSIGVRNKGRPNSTFNAKSSAQSELPVIFFAAPTRVKRGIVANSLTLKIAFACPRCRARDHRRTAAAG